MEVEMHEVWAQLVASDLIDWGPYQLLTAEQKAKVSRLTDWINAVGACREQLAGNGE